MPTATDELREALSGLAALAEDDLRRVWAEVSTADEAVAAFEDVLPGLVTTYSSAAAALAADWYDELRDAENIDGRFYAIVAEVDDKRAETLARWAAAPLYQAEPDWERAKTLVAGGTQLRIANTARQVVMDSSAADPRARGWQRSASGGCAFCEMLAGRGAVYSRSTVDFGAHDHCKCVAVPVWDGREIPVKPYTPTSRTITEADRARTRAWMREHLPGVPG